MNNSYIMTIIKDIYQFFPPNSGKSLLLGYQMMYVFSQNSVFSLGVSQESKSLFLGVLWHKGWLIALDGAFSAFILEVFIPIDKISRLQGVVLKVFVLESAVKRLLYQKDGYF